MLSGSIAALRGGKSGLRHMAGGSAAPSTRTAFVCSQGDQPNVIENVRSSNFELIENELSDTEGLTVSGGDPANTTLSIGNVVRGNVVRDKITPPWPEDPGDRQLVQDGAQPSGGHPGRHPCALHALQHQCHRLQVPKHVHQVVRVHARRGQHCGPSRQSPRNPSLPRPIPPSFPVLARACLWCLGARMWRVDLPWGVKSVPNPRLTPRILFLSWHSSCARETARASATASSSTRCPRGARTTRAESRRRHRIS